MVISTVCIAGGVVGRSITVHPLNVGTNYKWREEHRSTRHFILTHTMAHLAVLDTTKPLPADGPAYQALLL
jgi:hypothetical protein